MRDREMRLMLIIALAIALTGWTFGKGIKLAVIMMAPLPELAFETESSINRVWSANVQERMLRSLERDARAIEREAFRALPPP